NSPEWTDATRFYVNLVRTHGEAGAPQAGFTECLNNLEQGKVAMWYDATSAAGALEGSGSPGAGKIGDAQAPAGETKGAGWLSPWAWALQKASKHADEAWKFISWASGKDYLTLAGAKLGWASVPAGTRNSLYSNTDYQKAAAAFYKQTQDAISAADPK